MFATQTRDLSHIELTRSDNISSSSQARTYRVGEAPHIDRRKNKSKNRRILSFYSCSFCLYKGLSLAHAAFIWTNAIISLSGAFILSVNKITYCVVLFLYSNNCESVTYIN